jgi:hypothetical protein
MEKVYNGELHSLYSSPHIIRQIKSRRMSWAWHVVRMGEGKKCARFIVGKSEEKRPLGRRRSRWEGKIGMDLRDIGWGVGVSNIVIWLRVQTGGGF